MGLQRVSRVQQVVRVLVVRRNQQVVQGYWSRRGIICLQTQQRRQLVQRVVIAQDLRQMGQVPQAIRVVFIVVLRERR